MGADTMKPFQRVDHNPSSIVIARLIFASFTIVPLRLIAICILAFAFRLCLCILESVSAPDWLLRSCTRRSSHLALLVLGFWSIEEVGKLPSIDKKPFLIVSNHVSIIDVLYFMSTPLSPAFMMKQSCAMVPIVGYVSNKIGCILVHRTDKGKKRDNSARLLRHVQDVVSRKKRDEDYSPILVFPEATTTNGCCLLRFRTGAFISGEPVQPVIVNYPFHGDEFSVAYESISIFLYAWRLLAQFHHQMRVLYLDDYEPTYKEIANPIEFANGVQQAMQKEAEILLNVELPIVDQTYADKLKYHKWLRKKYDRLGLLSFLFYTRPDLVLSDNEEIQKSLRKTC